MIGLGEERRVRSVADLPDLSLVCALAGRHVGFYRNDPTWKRIGGWGPRESWEVVYRCDCGRWKRQVEDPTTGEVLSRGPQYGGGVLVQLGGYRLVGGISVQDARVEWWRRRRRAAA